MNSSDFRDDFINEIKSAAVTNMYSEQEAFFDIACDYISEAGEIQEFNRCYFNGKGRNGKTIQIDGYYFDTFSRELNLIICDYRSKFDTRELGITQIRKLVQDAIAFLENRDLLLNNIEESQQAYQFLLDLERIWPVINKTRVIILSTEKTKSIKKTEKFNIDEKEVYYNVWGIDRFEELLNNSSSSSKITINLLEHSEKGIPALYASNSKIYEYESYLTILPGNLLADLYDSYGAKLLEGNVRSFLSYRGKVNKAIRATLIGQPHMFFAFNNGIAATAADIETHSIEGELYIKSLTDFQIVNGGQTTASIFNVKHVRKEADLRDVYVPMKLNVVKNIDVAEKLIPIIAETANTQNKVNRADFFANSAFHRRVENISLRLTAPTIEGDQYGKKWFYERARGSYEAKLISFKTSNAKRDNFQNIHPKSQKISKTDLAKYYNSLYGRPHHVSKGSQRNFIEFANEMEKIWDKNKDIVNDEFYKKVVSICIIFKALEKIISRADWYQNAFRANIVTYSIAYFFNVIKGLNCSTFNFDMIWNYQTLPTLLEEIFQEISYKVFLEITKESPNRTRNVTEWCKKEECWVELKNNIKIDFIEKIEDFLLLKSIEKEKEVAAKKDQKLVNKVIKQIQVVELGEEFWNSVLDFGLNKKLLYGKNLDLIKLASKMNSTGRVPSEAQSKLILSILEELKMEGFSHSKL